MNSAEIENVLERNTGVLQAVVVLREDREGDKRLVAYLVASGPLAPDEKDLKQSVEPSLPDYMVPSHFVFLPQMPLTANGKIDRKALLKLPSPSQANSAASTSPVIPVDSMEGLISEVWRDALGVNGLDVNANFFDLGVHARLKEKLGRDSALIDLFQFSIVSTLAAHLSGTAPSLGDSRASRRARRQLS